MKKGLILKLINKLIGKPFPWQYYSCTLRNKKVWDIKFMARELPIGTNNTLGNKPFERPEIK